MPFRARRMSICRFQYQSQNVGRNSVAKRRSYPSPGPGNASDASVDAALGTLVQPTGSHNVAALTGTNRRCPNH